MKNIQYLLLAIVLVFSACRKDEIKTDYEFEPTTGGETVETRFSGQVIDEAGLPLQGAIIRLAGIEETSNEDGVFSFQNMKINEGGQLLTIEKSGFFVNVKRVTPTENTTFQKVGLIAKGAATGTFASADGGVISKPNGEKITFDANSIVDESGNDYNGTVEVYTHHFNPENPFLGELMPGDLSGISDEGNRVQLATYSMILAELYGESGQKLNLKSGTTAAVEFPIKGDAAANAPAEIPLWSLDELTGVWVEEGRATRDGNYYKAEVSHFSFWNCDDNFDLVILEGLVLDHNGFPLTNTSVSLEIVNGGAVRFGTTNSGGFFRGGVPADEEMVLTVINVCGEPGHKENIGPFNTDQQITINANNETSLLTISGSLKDCNGDAVTQGYVVVESDFGIKNILPVDGNGDFNSSIIVCQTNELSIYGVDENLIMQSPETVILYTGQPEEVIGDLQTCESIDEFIQMTLDGNDYLLTDAVVIIDSGGIRIDSNHEPLFSRYFIMNVRNPQEGINTPAYVSTGISDDNLSYVCNAPAAGIPPCTDMAVEITHMDDFVGGFIEGILTGQLWNRNGDLEEVTITFKVEIDFKLIYVGGRFWDDLNKNGIQDIGEPGIPDVFIYNNGPIQLNRAETDADGFYTIPMTIGEESAVFLFDVIVKPGYVITLQDQGMEDKDSDFSPLNGIAETVIPIEGNVYRFDCGIHLE